MKTKIFFIIIINCFLILGCNDSNTVVKEINPQIVLKINYVPSGYKYEDVNVNIYKSLEDYNAGTNKVSSGTFNSEGLLEITKNIKNNVLYYIDAFSNDNILSNWGSNKAFGTPEYKLIQTEYTSIKPQEVIIFENRKLIGKWNFSNYSDHSHHTAHDLTTRQKLIINKDLSIISYESYNNKSYKLNYEITMLNNNSCEMKFLSAEPSLNDYPFSIEAIQAIQNPNKTNLITFIPNSNKDKIEFRDHANEIVNYSK